MMASSQVDITSSKNPFGCILGDHNRRDGLCSVRTPQNNLKDLVRTRVRTRILVSSDANKIDSLDNKDIGRSPVTSSKKNSHVVDRWVAQCAQEMVSTIEERRNQEVAEAMTPPPPLSASSSPSSSPPHQKSKTPTSASIRGAAASSLVQIWEARLGLSTASSNCSRCDSPSSNYNDSPSSLQEADVPSQNVETLGDQLEPHRTVPEEPAPSEARRTTEKPRVADIIRRFISSNGRNSNKSASKDHDDKSNNVRESPPLKELNPNLNLNPNLYPNRDLDRSNVSSDLGFVNSPPHRLSSPNDSEQKGSSHSSQGARSVELDQIIKGSDPAEQRRLANISQCPRIRGRQALKDLLLVMEKDRKKELESLEDRKPVSRFTHKGRIQSLLKLKILQRGLALQDQWRPYSGLTQPHHAARGSALVHPREKFTNAANKIIKTITEDTASSSTCRGGQVSSASNQNKSTIIDEKKNNLEEPVHQSEEKNQSDALQSEPSSSSCATIHVPDVHDKTSLTSDVTHQVESTLQLHESSCATIDVPVPIDDSLYETSRASNATHHDATSNLQLHESSSPSSRSRSSRDTVDVVPAEDVCDDMSDTTYQDANGGGADSTGVPESMESCFGWYDQEWTTLQEEDQVNQDDDETLEMEEEDTTSVGGYEWFLGVSRPRSYWEDLRQSWYREMMEADSTKTDIRQLLERRTVSNLLTTSDFQDRMNNMMMTHLDEQTHGLINEEEEDQSVNGSNLETVRRFLSSYLQQQSQTRQNGNCDHGEEEEEATEDGEEENEEEAQEEHEEEQSEVDAEDEEEEEDDEEMFMRRQERMEEVMSNCLQVSSQLDIEEDEDEEEEEEEHEDIGEGDVIDENEYVREEEEEEEEESPAVARPYRDESSTDEYFNRNTRMMMRTLSCRNHPLNYNDRGIATIVHSRNPLSVAPYYRDSWQPFNSMHRLSMEMELINELREQMKQLHQEMSELRKSISICVDVQVNLQDSIKQEISTVRGERIRSEDRAPRKGYCCICYDKKVDSLLYRCGHMCTCLKCAHELQQGSGKCPMCRAPFLDVVRAYSDS